MWFFVLPAWPSMPCRCPSCLHERLDWLILCIQSGRLYGTGRYCGGFPARPAYRRCLTSPWGNEDTQQLIDILGKYKVKATFFVVGEWVDKYPESVKALLDAGHEVMNHSDTHAHMSQLSKDEIVADVEACNDKIEAVTGVRPTLIRPPYGEYDNNVITAIRSIGMEPIQWDVDSLDWKELEAPEIVERVTKRVQPGSIVLFHNAALHTPEALPTIIEALLQEGYTFVPISQLILPGEYHTDYTIDHTGRQCPV